MKKQGDNLDNYIAVIKRDETEKLDNIYQKLVLAITSKKPDTEGFVKLIQDYKIDCNNYRFIAPYDAPYDSENDISMLHFVASKGNVKILNLLMTRFGVRDVPHLNGNNALAFAAKEGNVDCVRYILNKSDGLISDSTTNNEDIRSVIALYFAVFNGHIDIVKTLIDDYGVDPNAVILDGPGKGMTPLYIAALKGHIGIIKTLIQNYGVNAKTAIQEGPNQGMTPLYVAAQRNNIDVIKTLIDSSGINTDPTMQEDRDEWITPLCIAAQQNNVEVIKTLIACGIDPNAAIQEGSYKGMTPLYIAAFNGHVEVIKTLIACGIDPNAAIQEGPNQGMTPLYIAAFNGHVEVIKTLVACSIDPAALIREGPGKDLTPIHIAALRGHVEVIKTLIACGIDPNAAIQEGPNQGMTPLYIAASKGHVEVIKTLIDDYGVNAKTAIQEGPDKGITLLCIAAQRNHIVVIKTLLNDYGIDPNAAIQEGPNQGMTPIYVAALNGHVETIKVLTACGVDPDTPIREGLNKGITPLSLALNNNYIETIKFLLKYDKGEGTLIPKYSEAVKSIIEINNLIKRIINLKPTAESIKIPVDKILVNKDFAIELFEHVLLREGINVFDSDVSGNTFVRYKSMLKERYLEVLGDDLWKELEEILDQNEQRYGRSLCDLEAYLTRESFVEYISDQTGKSKVELLKEGYSISIPLFQASRKLCDTLEGALAPSALSRDSTSDFALKDKESLEAKFMNDHREYECPGILFKELLDRDHVPGCGFSELAFRLNKYPEAAHELKKFKHIILPSSFKILIDRLKQSYVNPKNGKLAIAAASSFEEQVFETEELLNIEKNRVQALEQLLRGLGYMPDGSKLPADDTISVMPEIYLKGDNFDCDGSLIDY